MTVIQIRRRFWTEKDDKILRRLHAKGYTAIEIVERTGWSKGKIMAAHVTLGLNANTKTAHGKANQQRLQATRGVARPKHESPASAPVKPPAVTKEPEPYKRPPYDDNIHDSWLSLLPGRVNMNDPRGLMLDGQPISLNALMRETNRVRKRMLLPQFGGNPDWLV